MRAGGTQRCADILTMRARDGPPRVDFAWSRRELRYLCKTLQDVIALTRFSF
jgi:hypothetical protein